jgi:uncharacterized alkaline shock family protein YloU
MTNMTAEVQEKASGRPLGRTASGEVTARNRAGLLDSEQGQTKISDVVVQKIASLSAREVPGVRELGGGTARTIGALRERIPGAGTSHSQGVTVEVGERQVAVDLDLLIEYGAAIPALARAVRQNVIGAIEGMTGLEVVEVNINVVDVYLGEDTDATGQRTRVE